MKNRYYYSTRTGKNPNSKFDLPILRRLFMDTYHVFNGKFYFQGAFGYDCVDIGYVPGFLGQDIEAQIYRRLRKDNIWPIVEYYENYSEDDLFDMIEFLFDCVSKPEDGYYHSYGGCGWHYSSFEKDSGQQEYRSEINSLLRDYEGGFELSAEGEILILVDEGMETLLCAPMPPYDDQNVDKRIQAAIGKFRRRSSSIEDRRDAIRDLADVFEFLRPKVKEVLSSQDERDLFNIANNFGIRHHNEKQKVEYDKAIWHSWMFYYYLATIHACLRMIKKESAE